MNHFFTRAYSLVRYFLDSGSFLKEMVQGFIMKKWILQGSVRVIKLGKAFILRFQIKNDMDFVASQGSVNVNGAVFLLDFWSPKICVLDFKLNEANFWIQIHGVPTDMFDKKYIESIAARAGEVLVIDWNAKEALAKEFIRAKIRIPAFSPLVPGTFINSPANSRIWITFSFEKVFRVCYQCGRIGHNFVNCQNMLVDSEFPPYNKRIRAFPNRDEFRNTRISISTTGTWQSNSKLRKDEVIISSKNNHKNDLELIDVRIRYDRIFLLSFVDKQNRICQKINWDNPIEDGKETRKRKMDSSIDEDTDVQAVGKRARTQDYCFKANASKVLRGSSDLVYSTGSGDLFGTQTKDDIISMLEHGTKPEGFQLRLSGKKRKHMEEEPYLQIITLESYKNLDEDWSKRERYQPHTKRRKLNKDFDNDHRKLLFNPLPQIDRKYKFLWEDIRIRSRSSDWQNLEVPSKVPSTIYRDRRVFRPRRSWTPLKFGTQISLLNTNKSHINSCSYYSSVTNLINCCKRNMMDILLNSFYVKDSFSRRSTIDVIKNSISGIDQESHELLFCSCQKSTSTKISFQIHLVFLLHLIKYLPFGSFKHEIIFVVSVLLSVWVQMMVTTFVEDESWSSAVASKLLQFNFYSLLFGVKAQEPI